MATITARDGQEIIVDDDDLEWLSKYRWYLAEGYPYTSHRTPEGVKPISMHRLIMQPPKGMVVDHINRIRTDARRSNLRVVTSSENNKNKPPQAYVRFDTPTQLWWVTRNHKLLGMYLTRTEAKVAREQCIGGNFPSVTNTTIPLD